MTIPPSLKNKLSTLPNKPGVYIFRNSKRRVLYVGKAISLTKRVRSYFQKSRSQIPHIDRMVSKIADLEFIVTDSEKEALILEANLVRYFKPKYNLSLKDDKRYPLIKLTNEPFPRILVARRVASDGARYFGPFTDALAVKRNIKTVRRLFGIRDCKTLLPGGCVNFQIKLCSSPCTGEISKESYTRQVKVASLFLKGKKATLLKRLNDAMDDAVKSQNFEEAATLRDQISSVQKLLSEQKVQDVRLSNQDYIAFATSGDIASVSVFLVRDGRLIKQRQHSMDGALEKGPEEVISAFLSQYYLIEDVPSELVLPSLPDESEIYDWLADKRGSKVTLTVPKRGKKAKLLALAKKNAILHLATTKGRDGSADVTALKEALNLPTLPRHIEGLDISNIQGQDAVGSVVVFKDGIPSKKDYRKFKIRTVSSANDYAMLAEVAKRRYGRLKKEDKPMPDLILIDGGKGQLSAVLEALRELGLKRQPVLGLAKKHEEIHLPRVDEPVILPIHSAALDLLKRVRDEAHRFAISYHKTLRSGKASKSALDDIPGLGDARKRLLLLHFGSVRKMRAASLDELMAVPGIGKNTAKSIFLALKSS